MTMLPVRGVHQPIEVVDGHILYRLYRQDGEVQHMRCADTPSNRMFVVWVRRHDRRSGLGIRSEQETAHD